MFNGHQTALPLAVGRETRLVYVSDDQPGIRRIRSGKSFKYVNSRGQAIRSPRLLSRIRSLVIPPAWEDVWICPNCDGHLQATGRDVRGRKQYLYHDGFTDWRNREKFKNLRPFGRTLPRIRRIVARHLARPGLSREKVLAGIVMLLDQTLMRVGNEEYVRQNDSFGLTTLRNRHASTSGGTLRMTFRGKSGIKHDVRVTHRRLVKLVRSCQDLPGQRLFQYCDEDGSIRPVGSADVNEYLRTITGQPFTAKEFRTWKATAFVLEFLQAHGQPDASATAHKRLVVEAIRSAAAALGNTATVCRKYYVHPLVISLYERGQLGECRASKPLRGLNLTEQSLLEILKKAPANA
jgi:DNA topoisomerase-1